MSNQTKQQEREELIEKLIAEASILRTMAKTMQLEEVPCGELLQEKAAALLAEDKAGVDCARLEERVPLTVEQIRDGHQGMPRDVGVFYDGVRFAEAAHGIGKDQAS